MAEDRWKFELLQRVELTMSREIGIVVGRGEYSNSCDTYYVRYLAADGRQVSDWIVEDALSAVTDRTDYGTTMVDARYAPRMDEEVPF